MRTLNAEMALGVHGPSFFPLDRRLHHLLVGEGSVTAEVLDDIRDKIQRYLSTMVSWPSGGEAAVQEHERIIAAIESGDMERARDLLRRHIMRSRDFIAEKVATVTADVAAL